MIFATQDSVVLSKKYKMEVSISVNREPLGTLTGFVSVDNPANIGVVFGDVRYICSFITTGYSCDGITTKDGEKPPKADMYLCTCVPGGEQYEIYIIGIDKER